MLDLNPRVARTRRALAHALISLSRVRGYENVTITAVTQTANVSYSTFYRHYESLDDLLASLIVPAFDELKRRVSGQETLYDESLALFSFVQGYQHLYRIFLSLPNSHPIRKIIDRAALELLVSRYEQHEHTTVPFTLAVEIVEAITGRLIHLFLDSIDALTPEHMASMHYDLVVKGAAAATLKLSHVAAEPRLPQDTKPVPISEMHDSRAAQSRQALADALVSLALEKGYDQLTMIAVVQRARVSQSTFYRHYKNLDDLLVQLFHATIQQLIRRIKQQETLAEEALAIFTYIHQHQLVFRSYIALPLAHPARWAVMDAMEEFILERYEPRENSRVPLAVSVSHVIESAYQLIRWYLNHIHQYTVEQMAAIYIDIFVHATEAVALIHRRDWHEQDPGQRRKG